MRLLRYYKENLDHWDPMPWQAHQDGWLNGQGLLKTTWGRLMEPARRKTRRVPISAGWKARAKALEAEGMEAVFR